MARQAVQLTISGNFTTSSRQVTQVTGHMTTWLLDLEDGARVVYTDPRRFGFVDLIEPGGMAGNRFLANLGVEPLRQ